MRAPCQAERGDWNGMGSTQMRQDHGPPAARGVRRQCHSRLGADPARNTQAVSPLRVETDNNGVNLVTGLTTIDVPVLSVPAAPNLRFDRSPGLGHHPVHPLPHDGPALEVGGVAEARFSALLPPVGDCAGGALTVTPVSIHRSRGMSRPVSTNPLSSSSTDSRREVIPVSSASCSAIDRARDRATRKVSPPDRPLVVRISPAFR